MCGFGFIMVYDYIQKVSEKKCDYLIFVSTPKFNDLHTNNLYINLTFLTLLTKYITILNGYDYSSFNQQCLYFPISSLEYFQR